MVYKFEKPDSDRYGAYHYKDDEFEMVSVPIAEKTQGISLTKEDLHMWFGIEEKTQPPLPAYLISQELKPGRGDQNYQFPTSVHWWRYITGDIVVYRPIEWVPIVSEVARFPKSKLSKELSRVTTTTTTSKIYGRATMSMEVSAGANFKGMMVEAKATAETEVEASLQKEEIEKLIESGKLGDETIFEVAVGMLLKVEEVCKYSFPLEDLWAEDTITTTIPPAWPLVARSGNLHWGGSQTWGELLIPPSNFDDVKGFQFQSGSLWTQVLPLLNEKHEIKDMHIALSNSGWVNWYAYLNGEIHESHDRKTMPWIAWKPLSTFMTIK